GSLRGEFGVCTNQWSPADGRVVHLGYGCGAHSETGQEDQDREIQRSETVVVDELDLEVSSQASAADAPGDEAEAAPDPETAADDGQVEAKDAVDVVTPADDTAGSDPDP